MRSRRRRILAQSIALVAILPALAVLAVEVRWQRTFDAPYPDLRRAQKAPPRSR